MPQKLADEKQTPFPSPSPPGATATKDVRALKRVALLQKALHDADERKFC